MSKNCKQFIQGCKKKKKKAIVFNISLITIFHLDSPKNPSREIGFGCVFYEPICLCHVSILDVLSKQSYMHWSRKEILALISVWDKKKSSSNLKNQQNSNHKVYTKHPFFVLQLGKCLISRRAAPMSSLLERIWQIATIKYFFHLKVTTAQKFMPRYPDRTKIIRLVLSFAKNK